MTNRFLILFIVCLPFLQSCSDKNKVKLLSRKKHSDIYCSGIQIINPKKINKLIKKTEDFNIIWKRLMDQKKLHVSKVVPKKWFTIDSVNQLNLFKKKI